MDQVAGPGAVKGRRWVIPFEQPFRFLGMAFLRLVGVDGNDHCLPAALLGAGVSGVVHKVTPEGADQERTEPTPIALGGLEGWAGEKVLEEGLGQILGIMRRTAVAPEVGIKGKPILPAQLIQRLRSLCFGATRGLEHGRPLRHGKLPMNHGLRRWLGLGHPLSGTHYSTALPKPTGGFGLETAVGSPDGPDEADNQELGSGVPCTRKLMSARTSGAGISALSLRVSAPLRESFSVIQRHGKSSLKVGNNPRGIP